MRATDRILVSIGVVAVASLFAGAATAAWLAHAYGTVEVSVVSSGGSGSDVSIRLPGALVRLAAEIVPADTLRDASREIAEWLPLAQAALSEIRRCPDTRLVDVRSHGESVRITKRGDTLLAEVDSPTERVRVSIPLGTAAAVLEEIGESAANVAARR